MKPSEPAEVGSDIRQPRDRLVLDIAARLMLRGTSRQGERADHWLESVLAEVATHLRADLYVHHGAVEGDPRRLRLISCGGMDEASRARLEGIRSGERLCDVVAQTRKPLVLENLSHSGMPHADEFCAMGATAYAGYPMITCDRVMGTIAFATARRARFEPPELDLIETVAGLLAAALEQDRLTATVRESEARLRQTLEALRTSEQRFHDFADAAPAMLWVTDPTGYCTYLSRGWYKFTGQQEDEGHGLGWTAAIHPEERESAGQAFMAASEARAPYAIDFRLRRADGVYRWVLDAGNPHFDSAGVFCGFVGSVIDIDDRKRAEEQLQASEERFRAAVAATSELLWTNDADGRMIGEQPGWGGFTGQSFEEYQGYGWSQSVHPDDAQATIDAWQQAVAERRMFVWEHRVRRHDGVYRLFSIRAVPVCNSDGSIREWVGVHTDITNQRAAEEALREADRRKDEFLATLAHELRNPLAPVRTGLQIMKLAPNGTRAAAARDVMERQVGHMVRLIDDLLDVSRISRGKIELRKERLDLRAIVEVALEASRPLVDAGKHQLVVELPDEPVWLEADMTRLAQVVSNLVNNAAKYTPDGGRITLCARQEGARAVLAVTDTGIGIPPEIMPKVFELFVQGHLAVGRGQGGLGIGLTLVQRLVEMHGGTVKAESDGAARGSTFTVRLPVAAAPLREVHAKQPGELHTEARAKRVLVVDDNLDGAESLATLISLIGYETRTVHDGPAALVAAREYQPAAVVLDIGLPGLSGYEVAKRLRQDPAYNSTTLVALTGWGSENDKQRSRDAGFDFHLTKPVEASDLERVLKKAGSRNHR